VDRLDPAGRIEGAEPLGACVDLRTPDVTFRKPLRSKVCFSYDIPIDKHDRNAEQDEVMCELSADVADSEHRDPLSAHLDETIGAERRQCLKASVPLTGPHRLCAQFSGSGIHADALVGSPHFWHCASYDQHEAW
jgi:hypothetical protein